MRLRLHFTTALVVAVVLIAMDHAYETKKSSSSKSLRVKKIETVTISRKMLQDKARLAIIRCCGNRRCSNYSLRTRSVRMNSTLSRSRNISSAASVIYQKVQATPAQNIEAAASTVVDALTASDTITEDASKTSGNVREIVSTEATSAASQNPQQRGGVQIGTGGSMRYCTAPSCETFKKGQVRDTALVPKGSTVFNKDKFYFSSNTAVSLMNAAKLCFNLNMTILTINNLAMISSYFNLLEASAKASVWTSASAEGESCDSERQFAWCAIGVVLNESDIKTTAYWTKEPEAKATSDKCVTLNYDAAGKSVGLLAADCSAPKQLLCQPTCDSGSCMQTTCTRNETLFSNGSLKNAMRYGIWAEVCGSRYLFGNKVVNWTQNVEKCCKLGMQPIYYTTADQQSCLSKLTASNWTGNWNYWTGGFQSCKGLWGWCDGASEFQPMVSGLTWATNQPELVKDAENCLQMRINRNGSGVTLNDRECKDRFVYACQQSLLNATTGKVNLPFTIGDWYTTCGQKLLFPFKKATWNEAWNYCCSLGMKLIAVDSVKKHTCLSKFSKRYSIVGNNDLWTSAARGVAGLRWFSKNEVLVDEDTNWKGGKAVNADGDCVQMRFSNVSSNLTTFELGDCSQVKSFVCEVINNIDHSDADLKQMECMEIYNISDAEIEPLRSGSYNARTLSLKLKCFIKCIGDLTGLLMSGQFTLTIDALRVIEEQSATLDDLQTSMGVVDECGNPVNKDECERAAEIYQCSKEKAPAVVNAIQSTLTVNQPVGVSVHPYVPNDARFCRTKNLPCVVDMARQQQWLTTGATADGKKMVTASGKIYYVAPASMENRTQLYAHNYCCSLGMKIVEFLNTAQLNAIAPQLTDNDIILGDVYVTGQLQDVYCHSGITITENAFYMFNAPNNYQSITGKSCYHVVKQIPAIDTRFESACNLDEVPMGPTQLICEDV